MTETTDVQTFADLSAIYTYTVGGLTPSARVQAGADLLDEFGPDGWRAAIAENGDRLDLGSSYFCVLGIVDAVRNGQTVGDGSYSNERRTLRDLSGDVVTMTPNGFDGSSVTDTGDYVSDMDGHGGKGDGAILAEFWRAIVREDGPAGADLRIRRADRKVAKLEAERAALETARDAAQDESRKARVEKSNTRDLLDLVSGGGFTSTQVASLIRTFDRIETRTNGGYVY